MNSGDIFWIDFPSSDGHAQSGRRPAIIVQGAAASSRLPTVLVVPMTTQLGSLRFPAAIQVTMDEENGLRRDSVALVFQLTALDKKALGARLGKVSDEIMRRIWQAFDEITERQQAE